MRRVAFSAALLAAIALAASGCGSEGVTVAKDDPYHRGAVLFAENCAGCHTLSSDGAQGSSSKPYDKEKTDGPNFDARKETVETVLYAIRNGGFSGAIMPENILTGEDAQAVAEYLAKYSGQKAESGPSLENTTEPGSQ